MSDTASRTCAACGHDPACGHASIIVGNQERWYCDDDDHSCYVVGLTASFGPAR